jgi:hypothetical protein
MKLLVKEEKAEVVSTQTVIFPNGVYSITDCGCKRSKGS